MGWVVALALLQAAAMPATVTSAAPERVAVTVYRDPRRQDGALTLGRLQGRALVTETRTVHIPAGESVIRFEGVAGAIIPVSAIVTGLPDGLVEKNRDARLLSPLALVDGSLGRQVTLRRTDRATGRATETDAIVRGAADGGVVVETRDGIEALGCAGLPEGMIFAGVPGGLSARPTLSVTTRSAQAATAQVQLTYLAEEFDWAANYVLRIAPDGRTLSLLAWLTLANGNGESFAEADAFAVAGRVNQRPNPTRAIAAADRYVPALHCWPMDGTSTHPSYDRPESDAYDGYGGFGPPPPPPSPPMSVAAISEIVLTGRKRVEQSALGDLKLYHIPERVTFAANSQKQVAFLSHDGVPFGRVYRRELAPSDDLDAEPAEIRFRFRNDAAHQLGEPLPSGSVALFEEDGTRTLFVGDTVMRDTAVDEEVDLRVGQAAQVRVTQRADAGAGGRRIVEIANAQPVPVAAEIEFALEDGERLVGTSARLSRRNGRPLWAVAVPANGRVALRYRVKRPD